MRTDLDVFKWKLLRGSLLRRLILKALAFGCVMLFISISQIVHEVDEVKPLVMLDECPLNFGSNLCYNLTEFAKPLSLFGFPLSGPSKLPCESTKGLAKNVFRVLMDKEMLDSKANVLCIGAGSSSALMALQELGFSNTNSINLHPFFSLMRSRFVYELDFVDGYFDFVFSKAVDKVSVPALLVLEMERVLRPGGIGAMLVGGARDLYTGNMIRSATTVSSFIKSSDIVYACGVESFTLVIFEKRFPEVRLFENYHLPKDCPSITNNKPYMKVLEPLVAGKSTEFQRDVNYLPRFMNISSRNMLVYVNIGVKETTNMNTTQLFQPYNSIRDRDFNVFLIDHNASVLSSHVKNPGVSFIYHPALSNANPQELEFDDEYIDDEGFDLVHWFEETVKDNDFVVLRINTERVKYDILHEMFVTGAICHVDELFLHCSESVNCNAGSSCGDCVSLFKSLRNVGVFAHQWTGD